MKHLFLSAMLLLATAMAAPAQTPDDQYVRIYTLIQNGDALESSGQTAESRARYQEAQTALQTFQRVYPNWNPKVVNFRLNYLSVKLGGTAVIPPAKVAPRVPVTPLPPVKSAETLELERQLTALQENSRQQQENTRQLQENINQLQGDKSLLEAKLKEALSTQPAAVDPRELATAREQIRELMKENELLKTTAAEPPAATSAEKRALEEARKALAETNRKLETQTELAKRLAAERETLTARLQSLANSPATIESLRTEIQTLKQELAETKTGTTLNAATARRLEEARQALVEANRKVESQSQQVQALTEERETLQQRLQALAGSPAALAALRAEHEIIKKQLAEARSSAAQNADAAGKLAQAQSRITTLQSDAEVARLEKIALENRVKTLNATAAGAPPVVASPAELERIKKLENERDELARKLNEANKELGSRRSRAASAKIADLGSQIETLRARVQVFEARAVPYTAEELALFQKPAPQLAKADPKAGKKPISKLPSGVSEFVVSAQKHFAAQEFDQAEKDYLEILRRDESNAYTLANLAAIQLERGNLAEAEKNVTKAVATAPEDDYALLILGQVKFRQEQYDDSLDAFTKAAKLKPQSAELQNYLGVVLGHKGLRDAAEKALRRAIVLNPGYADAHYNLAVFYGTKDTTFLNLARWHYQRATAAGHAPNPELEKLFESKTTVGETK